MFTTATAHPSAGAPKPWVRRIAYVVGRDLSVEPAPIEPIVASVWRERSRNGLLTIDPAIVHAVRCSAVEVCFGTPG